MDQPIWSFKADLPHCQIWQHRSSLAIVEAYPIQNYQRTHSRVNRNKKHLVNSLGAVHDNRLNRTYLLIQRISSRLSELRTLNQAQTLKVLLAIFKGLQQLQQIYGLVRLCQQCVCFNQNGNVKIWVNPDLSSLHPILPVKDNNKHTIMLIIIQVISMVQRKCFNSSFLSSFVYKINQHQINDFRQAAEQTLRLAEALFIDINDRDNKKMYNQSYANFAILPERDFNKSTKNLKTENKSKVENDKVLHQRKFSTYDTNDTNKKDKNMRGMPNYPIGQQGKTSQCKGEKEMGLNTNVTTGLTIQIDQALFHKSAPLSPRDNQGQNYPNKRASDKFPHDTSPENKNIRNNANKPKNFQKKIQKKSYVVPALKETQCQDSFSRNLKFDQRQIIVSGDFQTFGLLQDLNMKPEDHKVRRQPYSYHVKEKQFKRNKQNGLDLKELDRQMQRLLDHQTHPNAKKQKQSFNQCYNYHQKQNNKVENYQAFKKPDLNFTKKQTPLLQQIQNQKKNRKIVPSMGKNLERQRSDQRKLIDRKMETSSPYQSNSLTKKLPSKHTNDKQENFSQHTGVKHVKNYSNYDKVPMSSTSSTNIHSISNFSTINHQFHCTEGKYYEKNQHQMYPNSHSHGTQTLHQFNKFRPCTQR